MRRSCFQTVHVELLSSGERASEQLREIQGGAGHIGGAFGHVGSDADRQDDGREGWRDEQEEEEEDVFEGGKGR